MSVGGSDEQAAAQCPFMPVDFLCEGEPARDTLDFTAEVVTWVTVRVWVVTCHPVTGGGLAAAGLAKSAAGAARVAANVGYTGDRAVLYARQRSHEQAVFPVRHLYMSRSRDRLTRH